MATPPDAVPLAALDRATLDRVLEPDVRRRLADALPFARRAPDEVRAAFAAGGLLGPTDTVVVVGAPGARAVAHLYAPDAPHVATTLRVALAALDDPAAPLDGPLGAVVDHIFRTTTVVRVERAVAADDARARAECAAAGLRLEAVRPAAALARGRVVDLAVFVAVRDGWRARRPAPRPIARLGVLTAGGDAPGLNAVIRAVVKTSAVEHGWQVLGIEGGFEGLVGEGRARPLAPDDVRGLLPRGGTILGTTNRGRFNRHDPLHAEALDDAVAGIGRLGVDALVTVGGDGTQTIAHELAGRGIRVVGVPKTIDNDLEGTDLTFGFDTALALATDAIDRLHTTAESHGRVMVVEVMGRRAGWIALHAAIAGGADVALLPELPFSVERVAEAVLGRERAGHHFSIIVVAEGARPAGADAVGERVGVGAHVADRVERLTGKDTRVVVLGHLQRGGRPTAFDRLLATAFGAAAVRALAAGASDELVALRGGELATVPLASVANRCRRVPLDSPLLRAAAGLGIELGSPLARARP